LTVARAFEPRNGAPIRRRRVATIEWICTLRRYLNRRSATDVIGYIQNQREHPRMKTFKEEFLAFFTRHEIDFDKRYLWD
jgi:hypothetical protein